MNDIQTKKMNASTITYNDLNKNCVLCCVLVIFILIRWIY